jgi:hypothetical protein
MPPRPLVTTTLALLGLLALPSCAALQEIAALRLASASPAISLTSRSPSQGKER